MSQNRVISLDVAALTPPPLSAQFLFLENLTPIDGCNMQMLIEGVVKTSSSVSSDLLFEMFSLEELNCEVIFLFPVIFSVTTIRF